MDLLEKIQSDKFYLIDFYAAWCAPCKMQVEILDDLQTKLPSDVEIIKIDVDLDKLNTIQFDAMYQVQGVPTLMLFHQGKLLWKHYGVKFRDDLLTIINQHVNN